GGCCSPGRKEISAVHSVGDVRTLPTDLASAGATSLLLQFEKPFHFKSINMGIRSIAVEGEKNQFIFAIELTTAANFFGINAAPFGNIEEKHFLRCRWMNGDCFFEISA